MVKPLFTLGNILKQTISFLFFFSSSSDISSIMQSSPQWDYSKTRSNYMGVQSMNSIFRMGQSFELTESKHRKKLPFCKKGWLFLNKISERPALLLGLCSFKQFFRAMMVFPKAFLGLSLKIFFLDHPYLNPGQQLQQLQIKKQYKTV